jgi:catechol-2,3-dioxygenase
MKEHGIEPYSPYVDAPEAHRPYAEDAVKDPDGNRFDLSTGMRAVRTADAPLSWRGDDDRPSPARIRHIAIFSDDPARLARFYVDVFGLTVTGESQGDVWVTEGYSPSRRMPSRKSTGR